MRWSASSERHRVATCGTVGVIVGGATSFVSPWELAVLAGWVATATIVLAWIWLEIGRLDGDETAQVATRADDSRAASRFVLVIASVVSLLAIVAALHRASSSSGAVEAALTVAAIAAVTVSWLVVNTVFALHYAHLYHGGESPSGLAFPGDEPPSYRDVAYFAFTIGMTYQVSDVAVTDGPMRAMVLRHSLLSYLFGVVIIATAINVIAGLV